MTRRVGRWARGSAWFCCLAVWSCGGAQPEAANPPVGADPAVSDPVPRAEHELPPATEEGLAVCWSDEDCVVVPYRHCCGSTRRAIHRGYLEAYEAHPEWQVFDDPGACAVMGMCVPDEDLTEARCGEVGSSADGSGYCGLVRPDSP